MPILLADISPEQIHELARAIVASSSGVSFNWAQGAMALGATLVSVTGVVVGMRSSIAALTQQLQQLSRSYDGLSKELRESNERTAARLAEMAKEIAVLKYAQGVEAHIGPHEIG